MVAWRRELVPEKKDDILAKDVIFSEDVTFFKKYSLRQWAADRYVTAVTGLSVWGVETLGRGCCLCYG